MRKYDLLDAVGMANEDASHEVVTSDNGISIMWKWGDKTYSHIITEDKIMLDDVVLVELFQCTIAMSKM
ncbi:hypothetical protein CE143_17595 [Photorhabdus luminescens]|uniref:Uncharacterized protein n=1 Tax=Photorhabdus akhurstii TaxID=171438 RepID=A0ABX8M065_9GAMM|nr:hypothetical protein [Photorhabdus akhurstii]QXF34778.1 hypothetical protein B0X70_17585 [Photorhabdus akhurstii]UJD76605.1 hypothetical protein CE143_17595 [Photorhabdus luminescens]